MVKTIIEDCVALNNSKRHIVTRDGSERSQTGERGNTEVLAALNRRALTLGIAPDARRYLPHTLLRTVEYRPVLPPIDEWALKLTLEAITGEAPVEPIDPQLIRAADVNDLSMAIRKDLSPAQCIARLTKLLDEKVLIATEK